MQPSALSSQPADCHVDLCCGRSAPGDFASLAGQQLVACAPDYHLQVSHAQLARLHESAAICAVF